MTAKRGPLPPTLDLTTAHGLRKWLADHPDQAGGAWVIVNKKPVPPGRLGYEQAVDEALCQGWIDGGLRPLDGTRFRLFLAPRRRRSLWSRHNRKRAERLIAAGRMTTAGLAKVEGAKADGSWTAIDELESLSVPADFGSALSAAPAAEQAFETLSPSARRVILASIRLAKRPETRRRRITEAVARLPRPSAPESEGI